jgi:hypothetical protein
LFDGRKLRLLLPAFCCDALVKLTLSRFHTDRVNTALPVGRSAFLGHAVQQSHIKLFNGRKLLWGVGSRRGGAIGSGSRLVVLIVLCCRIARRAKAIKRAVRNSASGGAAGQAS